MGFDNECIVNIQTLNGEYFCPVCRLLVYPHEALQSQCTHLYCKPCLAYVVSTTQACPYDGYLVTKDSKPLVESNRELADTIGKIPVKCLFYRSGCNWQGLLSDCSSHCSACTFGNSPVVCNRCAIQIVHRQVQEHAQTCQGVQPQAIQAGGTQNLAITAATTPANGDQPQAASQSGATKSVTKSPQTGAVPATGQDPNLQASANPQSHGVVPGAVLTPEQLYQQQYYQQYPGYAPYQLAFQNYYPYPMQSQVYAQPPHMQPYPQPQPLSHPQPQAPVPSQTPVQSQALPQPQSLQNVNTQYQIPNPAQPSAQMMPPAQPPSQGYLHPYHQSYGGGQPNQQTRPPHPQSQPMQMPQFQQPQMQHQPSTQPPSHTQAHPQHQAQQAQAHPYPQPMNQALNPNVQTQTQQSVAHAVSGYNSYSQPQAQQQMQMGTQQRPNIHPQSGPVSQIPIHPQGQYPPQLPPVGVAQSAVPNQQLPHQAQVSVVPPMQQSAANPYAQQPGHSAMQQMQQSVPQQHGFPGQASGPAQNQFHPQHMQLPPPPPSEPHPQVSSAFHPHQHQNYSGRPVMPNHGAQPQPFGPSLAGYPDQALTRPPHSGWNQPLSNQSHPFQTNNQLQKNDYPSQKTSVKEVNGSGIGTESIEAKNLKAEKDVKLGVNGDANVAAELLKEENSFAQSTSDGRKSHETVLTDSKAGADGSQQHEKLTVGSSKEGGADMGVQVASVQSAHTSSGSVRPGEMQYPPSCQQGPAGTISQPAVPPGVPHPNHAPGQRPNMLRPQGPGQLSQSGQPFNLPLDHFQHPPYGRPPSQFGGRRMPAGGEPTGSFNTGGYIGRIPPYGAEGQLGNQQRPIGPSGNDFFPDPRSSYLDGQSPGSKSQVVGTNSSMVRMHNENSNSLIDLGPMIHEKEPFGGYRGHHMDRFDSRSPGRVNVGFPPRNFGSLESRPFDEGPRPFKFPSDPAGSSFHESRFPPLPGQLRQGELDGPGFMRSGEFQDPGDLPGHMPFSNPAPFGDFPGPPRRGDLQHHPFGKAYGGKMPGHSNLGDHGFSSSYPSSGGLDPFGSSRNQMFSGWCRICKVDCEGVEGLELHCQTREHQDMAIDMARSIKLQNPKKQKVSNDRSSLEEPSKRSGSGHEIRGSRR